MIRPAGFAAALLSLLVASAASAAPMTENGKIPTTTGGSPEMAYVPGEVLVRFDASADAGDRAQLRDRVDASLEDATLGVKGLQLLELEGDESPEKAADRLNAAAGVKYAHPNYVQDMYATPNDPDFPFQWGAFNRGQLIEGLAGTAGADVDAQLAWDRTTGNPGFTAAIMDSGIQTDHADFAPNVVPGVDVTAPATDSDPRDLNGHGSHVGGITGAAGNNGVGTAGMTWNTKIMPVRINVDVGVPVANQVRGFQAVKAAGVRLVNGSFGGRGGEIPAQRDAIAAASNTLFIMAAGNEGTSLDGNPSYPCAYELPNIVCVGASTNQETPADFSNFSPRFVDLFAPGKDMRSVENTAVHALNPPSGNDFEDGTGQAFQSGVEAGNWTVGSPGLSGSAFAATGFGNPGRLASANISTVGMSNCALIVTVGGYSVSAGDAARIGVRVGGGAPNFLTTLNGSEGLPGDGFDFAMPLQGYEGIPNLQVVIEVTTSNFRYVFDDIRVKCNPNGVTGTSTKYISGTSQAAPVVTGVAALIFGQQPSRPLSEVRAALLDSVERLPAYAGKSVTGGRVNANSAVAAGAAILAARTPPVPSRLSLTNRSFAAMRGKGPSVVREKSAKKSSPAQSSAKKKAKKKKAKKKKAKGGTVLKFNLNKPGNVSFAVSRTFTGVKTKKGACKKAPAKAKKKKKAKKSAKKKKKKKSKKCTGATPVGSFTYAAAAGANRVRFTGRVANKRLKVAKYKLTATGVASNRTTRSAAVSTKFSIRGAKAKKKSKRK